MQLGYAIKIKYFEGVGCRCFVCHFNHMIKIKHQNHRNKILGRVNQMECKLVPLVKTKTKIAMSSKAKDCYYNTVFNILEILYSSCNWQILSVLALKIPPKMP